jgi:hypothetical protein
MKVTLNQVLLRVQAARDNASRPVVVFDLDDTLLSTTDRHLRILSEFAEEIREARPSEAEILSRLGPEKILYSIADTAKAAGIHDSALLARLWTFWFARFFTNSYLGDDRAVEGAADYCRQVLEKGAVLVYLTGRDEAMRVGTLAALAENGLPLPDAENVHLMLKPSFEMADAAFKLEALRKVSELGEVVAAFENEPAHVNMFRDAFPSSTTVLLDTRHAGKPIEPYADIPKVPDFRPEFRAAIQQNA